MMQMPLNTFFYFNIQKITFQIYCNTFKKPQNTFDICCKTIIINLCVLSYMLKLLWNLFILSIYYLIKLIWHFIVL
jgi:hypothetical protein